MITVEMASLSAFPVSAKVPGRPVFAVGAITNKPFDVTCPSEYTYGF